MTNPPKPKILLVDDDFESREIYRAVFEQAGFEVKVADDGLQGYDLAFETPPDLVFTGVIMPKMDGFELIDHLRKHVATAQIPVIIFSHLGREEDRQKALTYPHVAFMVKGSDKPRDILAKAKHMMGVK